MMTALLLACPSCVGDPNSKQVQGAQAGVLVLLVIVVGLLVGIAFIARSWARRARELEAAQGRAQPRTPWFALGQGPAKAN